MAQKYVFCKWAIQKKDWILYIVLCYYYGYNHFLKIVKVDLNMI